MIEILSTVLDALSDAKTAMEEVSAKDNKSAQIVSAAIHKAREAFRLYDKEAQEPAKDVINEKCYVPYGKESPYKQITLEVTAILDMVPGAWHQPEDLMNWIATHSYVQLVQQKTPPPRETEQVSCDDSAVAEPTITQDQIDDLIADLLTCARESQGGRNFAKTPRTCQKAANALGHYRLILNDLLHRLDVNRQGIIDELGYIAAKGAIIRAVKIYRSIYGVGLLEAKKIVMDARAKALTQYNFDDPNDKRIEELEACLAQTRFLVGVAAWYGFGDEESLRNLFVNNGEITKLVPTTAMTRGALQNAIDDPRMAKAAEHGWGEVIGEKDSVSKNMRDWGPDHPEYKADHDWAYEPSDWDGNQVVFRDGRDYPPHLKDKTFVTWNWRQSGDGSDIVSYPSK